MPSSPATQQPQPTRPRTSQQLAEHCQNMRLHGCYMINNSNLMHQIRNKQQKIVVQKNDFVLFRGLCCLAHPTLLRKECYMSIPDCILSVYPAIKTLLDGKQFLKALEQAVLTAGDDIVWKCHASMMLSFFLISVAHVYHDIRQEIIEDYIEEKSSGQSNPFAPNPAVRKIFYEGMDEAYLTEQTGQREERRLAFETSKRALEIFETNVWKELEAGKISLKDLYFCCVSPSLDVKKKGKTAAEGFVESYGAKRLPDGTIVREVALISVYLDFLTLEEARAYLYAITQYFENTHELLLIGKHPSKTIGYEKALEIDPNCVKALFELAMLFEKCGNILNETSEGDGLTFECFTKAAYAKEAQAKAMLGGRLVQPQPYKWNIEMPTVLKVLSARQEQEFDLLMHQVKKFTARAEKLRVLAQENGLVHEHPRTVDQEKQVKELKVRMEYHDAQKSLKSTLYHLMMADYTTTDKCSSCLRTDQKLKKCSGCGMASYCGIQRKHWTEGHKHACATLRDRYNQIMQLMQQLIRMKSQEDGENNPVALFDDRLFISQWFATSFERSITISQPEGTCSCKSRMYEWSMQLGCQTREKDDLIRTGVFQHVNPRTCVARDAHLRAAAIKGDAEMCSFFLAHGANPRVPVRHLLAGSQDMIGLNALEIMGKKGFVLKGNKFVPKAA